MSFEMAKKAIDLYFLNSAYIKQKSISFYGGEPLLEFDLIKQCVEYSCSKCSSNNIEFHMTTNASLLTEDMLRFFHKHNFYITISIDGYEEYHNKNRKFY